MCPPTGAPADLPLVSRLRGKTRVDGVLVGSSEPLSLKNYLVYLLSPGIKSSQESGSLSAPSSLRPWATYLASLGFSSPSVKQVLALGLWRGRNEGL